MAGADCLRQQPAATHYGDIGKATGLFPAGLGPYLDAVNDWCRERQIPALTVIVVSGTTGNPSDLPEGVADIGTERERVFNYPWFKETPPHPDEL